MFFFRRVDIFFEAHPVPAGFRGTMDTYILYCQSLQADRERRRCTGNLEVSHLVGRSRLSLKLVECQNEQVESLGLLNKQNINVQARDDVGNIFQANDDAFFLSLLKCLKLVLVESGHGLSRILREMLYLRRRLQKSFCER